MADDTDIESDPLKLSSGNMCKLCNKKVSNVRSDGVKCKNSKCATVVHQKCFDYVSKAFFVERSIWRCKLCAEKGEIVSLGSEIELLKTQNECFAREKHILEKYATELEFSNTLLKDKLKETQLKSEVTMLNEKMSYSDSVKKGVSKKSAVDPVLIVRSTNQNTTGAQVEKDIKASCNISALKVKVNNTKHIKGGLLIQCPNVESRDKLKQNLEAQVGGSYSITSPEKWKPRVVIYDVPPDAVNEELFISDLIANNDLPSDEVRLVTNFNVRNKRNVVIEVSSTVFRYIMKTGYLYAGWRKCYVNEHIRVARCLKCCKYGHFQKYCKESITCFKCAEGHESNNCKNEVLRCINCILYNRTHKTHNQLPTDHAVNDKNCQSYQYQLQLLKNKINYDD